MKKKLLIIGISLALLLTGLMPASAFAAKPVDFNASGIISYLTPSIEFPAEDSGRIVVVERSVLGVFTEGPLAGIPYDLTYKANVELETQAGNLHGTLIAGPYVFKVNGKINPLEIVPLPVVITIPPELFPPDGLILPAGLELPKLSIEGHWTAIEGMQGTGNFSSWAFFIPLGEHVGPIALSSINVFGKAKP